MATTIVELSGDEAKLLRSFQKIIAKEAELAAGLKTVGDEGEKAGDKVGDGLEGAAQKSTKEFDAVVRSLRKMGPEGRKVAGEIEAHLRDTGKGGRESMDSVIERLRAMDPEAAEAAAAMRKHISDEAEVVEAKLIKLPTPFEKIKRAASEAFGAQGLSSLSTYAVGLGGITAAVSLIGASFELMKEKQEAALASLQAQADPERRLAQIANSGEDLDQMIAQADLISMQYGMDRNQSRSLIFSARSEGFASEVDQIARFGRVVDVESQGALAGSLGRLFADEGLSVEQRLSGVLAAASTSAFDFETVGASVKKSAAASGNAGSDLAETLAANATLANLIGETAGDRISTFASKVALDKELAGSGLLSAALTLRDGPAERREKFLGDSKELNEAYTLITQNADALREMTTAVRTDIAATTEGRGMLRNKTEIVENSERFQQREMVRRAEITREITEESAYSADGAAIAIAQDSLQAGLADRGVNWFNQTLLSGSMSNLPLIGGILPDISAGDVAIHGGNMVGIAPDATARTLTAMAASSDPTASDSWMEFAAKAASNVGSFGGSPALLAADIQSDGEGGVMGRLIREQNDLQRQSLEAAQQTASALANRPAPNYSSGQAAAASAAAMP